jgi:hypothetical protein
MTPPKRLLVPLGAILLLVSAGVAARLVQQTQNTPPAPNSTVRQVDRFTGRNVLVPQPMGRPATPSNLRLTSEVGALRADWTDAEASGYEVTWRRAGELDHTMLTIQPEVRLGGLRTGVSYSIEVRAVDAYGQRSNPAAASGTPAATPDDSWKKPLTGLFDDFSDVTRLTARWHLSGYRGCVDAGTDGGRGLTIGLECGADQAMLRARSRMTLAANQELGRIAVVTDSAGPGGQLTVDLSPGPVDRVGSALPAGTVQVVVDDQGARVLAADDVPRVPVTGSHVDAAPARGVGVPHRFEVVLTAAGISVAQDGREIGFGGVVPSWRAAYVLFGFQGPAGLASRVHVDAAGFSGPSEPVPFVAEQNLVPATLRALAPSDTAPGIGISRNPLIGARSARYVATVQAGDGLDPAGLSVQLGPGSYPLVQAVPGPTPAGAVTTVYADLPPALLTAGDPLSPYVLRSARGPATIVESYLEIHTAGPPPPSALGPLPAAPAAVRFPLVKADETQDGGRAVLDITLDGRYSAEVAGVAGFEVWLDGQLVAGQPTAGDGPGLGGRYTVVFSAGSLSPGRHVFDVRAYPVDAAQQPMSALKDVTVT